MFTEVTEEVEIRKLLSQMHRVVRQGLRIRRTREITSPYGVVSADVRFGSGAEETPLWWYIGRSPRTNDHLNQIGHGDPDSDQKLAMDLQFNFHSSGFDRKKGGAFVLDETGRPYLAHRAIATRGRSRIKKKALLRESGVTVIHVQQDDTNKQIPLMLVAPLDAADFLREVSLFVSEIRRVSNALFELNDGGAKTSSTSTKADSVEEEAEEGGDEAELLLKTYFEEFSGKHKGYQSGRWLEMDWKHGRILKALQQKLASDGEHFKNRELDLLVVRDLTVHLFEVKTSEKTTSLYTGIGQLVLHGAAVTRKYPGKKVFLHLVVPLEISAARRQQITAALGIQIVSYGVADDGVTFEFEGLDGPGSS